MEASSIINCQKVNTGNIKRSLKVPLKNHKVSVLEGPKTK